MDVNDPNFQHFVWFILPLSLESRFKDSRELRQGRKYEFLFWDDKASLVIKNTEPNDSGSYRCEISNPLGSVQTAGNLTVYSKYKIVN